jgi:hypothetical protein
MIVGRRARRFAELARLLLFFNTEILVELLKVSPSTRAKRRALTISPDAHMLLGNYVDVADTGTSHQWVVYLD